MLSYFRMNGWEEVEDIPPGSCAFVKKLGVRWMQCSIRDTTDLAAPFDDPQGFVEDVTYCTGESLESVWLQISANCGPRQ